MSAYRKPIVLALPNLIEFDKVEIVLAERLAYQGLLPKCNVEKMLKEKIKNRMMKDADERMERELRIEIRTEQGIDSRQALALSLEELADEKDLTVMTEMVSDMLTRQHQQFQENKNEQKER